MPWLTRRESYRMTIKIQVKFQSGCLFCIRACNTTSICIWQAGSPSVRRASPVSVYLFPGEAPKPRPSVLEGEESDLDGLVSTAMEVHADVMSEEGSECSTDNDDFCILEAPGMGIPVCFHKSLATFCIHLASYQISFFITFLLFCRSFIYLFFFNFFLIFSLFLFLNFHSIINYFIGFIFYSYFSLF